jgi:hypothetical protein
MLQVSGSRSSSISILLAISRSISMTLKSLDKGANSELQSTWEGVLEGQFVVDWQGQRPTHEQAEKLLEKPDTTVGPVVFCWVIDGSQLSKSASN